MAVPSGHITQPLPISCRSTLRVVFASKVDDRKRKSPSVSIGLLRGLVQNIGSEFTQFLQRTQLNLTHALTGNLEVQT